MLSVCILSLAAFFFQKLEAQEKEDSNLGKAIKLVKGKVGKPKVKKMNLEETLPSPFGRRVEPPTQPIKSDAAKKLTKKKKVTAAITIITIKYDEYAHWDSHKLVYLRQGEADSTIKMEFDDDGVGGEGGTGENSVAKPKAPRVKKEKKEPGQFQTSTTHASSIHV